MSIPLDSIPQAVATIVSSCYGKSLDGFKPEAKDEIEQRIINFADKLTRTMVNAMLDGTARNT